MPFEEVMIYMLLSMKCSTQSALRRFFTACGKYVSIKQQSFSETRTKIKVAAFVDLFRMSAVTMTQMNHKKWNGYRIYAVDGTKIALPADKKLAAYYGTIGRGNTSPTAQGSILYDVLNDIVIDGAIEPLSYDERTLAAWHLNACESIVEDAKKLVIFDRGYASVDLISKLESDGFHYIMRVRTKFNNDIDAQTTSDGYVTLEKEGNQFRVRVVKIQLDSGETETLITNITDKRLGVKAFKELYFLRWPIETKYNVVKNKLHIEHFSTRTIEGIGQEFYATLFLANVASAAVHDAEPIITKERINKNNKYTYHANVNEAIGVLKDRLVLAFAVDDPDYQNDTLEAIVVEIKSFVVPYKPNRSYPRDSSRKARFHHNRKANC
jgi:hypothetical protein